MSIVTETVIIDNREFTRTYSDAGRSVVRDGVSYTEAVDPSEFGRIYTEGDPIEDDDMEGTAQELLDILLGGSEE